MSQGSTFDDNRDAERRSSDKRRKDDLGSSNNKRAEQTEERRQSTDRRGWHFGLILRTTESYSIIEEWLEDNSVGEWGLGLEDMDEALAQKSFKIMFELETDKNNFVAIFSKR